MVDYRERQISRWIQGKKMQRLALVRAMSCRVDKKPSPSVLTRNSCGEDSLIPEEQSLYSASAYGAGRISKPAILVGATPDSRADSIRLPVPKQGSSIMPRLLSTKDEPAALLRATLVRVTRHAATAFGV